MAKENTLGALNESLFKQLERLTADDMDRDAINAEIDRSKAVSGLANSIIQNGRLMMQAQQAAIEAREMKRMDSVARKMLE